MPPYKFTCLYDFQIVGNSYFGQDHGFWSYVMEDGWGIWTGITFCLSGGIGLVGSSRPSQAM